jgi:hypothetical protein
LVGEGVKIRRRGKKSIYLDDQLGEAREREVEIEGRCETSRRGGV